MDKNREQDRVCAEYELDAGCAAVQLIIRESYRFKAARIIVS